MRGITLTELLKESIDRLENSGIADASWDARELITRTLRLSSADYILYGDRMPEELSGVTETDLSLLEDRIRQREKRVPLQYILGEAWFYKDCYYVAPGVLIPRQDTESVVEEVLRHFPKEGRSETKEQVLLDLCTGSGCILLSCLLYGGFDRGTGVDLSPAALQIAKKNRDLLRVRQAELLEGDLFGPVHGKRFDCIVSNPPYVTIEEYETLEPEVKDEEPFMALVAEENGLRFYREIIEKAPKHLKKNGWLVFETGCLQAEAVSRMMTERGFEKVSSGKDLAGKDRFVSGCWRKEEICLKNSN